MTANKKQLTKTTTAGKDTAKKKLQAEAKPENPAQFEEQRSTALRMKPQPLGAKASTKNKK